MFILAIQEKCNFILSPHLKLVLRMCFLNSNWNLLNTFDAKCLPLFHPRFTSAPQDMPMEEAGRWESHVTEKERFTKEGTCKKLKPNFTAVGRSWSLSHPLYHAASPRWTYLICAAARLCKLPTEKKEACTVLKRPNFPRLESTIGKKKSTLIISIFLSPLTHTHAHTAMRLGF